MATSRGLKQFGDRMTKVSEIAANGVESLIKEAALQADQVAVLATPVATGRARANWIVSLRRPSRRAGVKPNKGLTGEAQATASANRAIGQGQRTIAQFELEKHGAIFITNNVPYIVDLDNGSSAQAPAGMSRAAIAAAAAVFRRGSVLKGRLGRVLRGEEDA